MTTEQLQDIVELIREWQTDERDMIVNIYLPNRRYQFYAKKVVDEIDTLLSNPDGNGLLYFFNENHEASIIDIQHIANIEIF